MNSDTQKGIRRITQADLDMWPWPDNKAASWIESDLLPWLELHKTTMSSVGQTVIQFIETNKGEWK